MAFDKKWRNEEILPFTTVPNGNVCTTNSWLIDLIVLW